MSVSVAKEYNNRYIGNLSMRQIELIEEARRSSEVSALRNSIFDFPKELVERSIKEEKSIRQILKEEGIDHTQFIGTLKNYQTVGAAFMYLSPRSILGDGVGLGKTPEVCALLNFLFSKSEIKRFLMAVENSAIAQTVSEIIRFTGLRVISLPSEAVKLNRVLKKLDFSTVNGIVIKHSALRSDVFSKWLAINLNPDGGTKIFDTFILDESSVIKHANTKTYTYTKNICDLAGRVHFMNATAFETHIMDIYYQMDMMDSSVLPRESKIQKRFCRWSYNNFWKKEGGKAVQKYARVLTGYDHQEEFKSLLGLFYFGRGKSDVGLDRPNIYKVYTVEPSNDQSLAIAKGQRYNEVLNCPSLIEGMTMSRKTTPKLDRLIDLVENEFHDSSVMIYAFHIEAQKQIKKELEAIGRKPVILNGEVIDEERYDVQNKFNDGTYDVLITNIQKSLNLYGGDVCIFYSVLTNPSAMFQVAGRIDRNVDDRIKTFVLMLYSGTDEYRFFTNVVRQRAQDARDLTIDAKTTVDYFVQYMIESGENT